MRKPQKSRITKWCPKCVGSRRHIRVIDKNVALTECTQCGYSTAGPGFNGETRPPKSRKKK